MRKFLKIAMNGELAVYHFSFLGYAFARDYYDFNHHNFEFFYPADVDACAEEYFGTEKYNSEEFKDEAYLFAPFDEEYYQRLSKYIDRAFQKFYPDFRDYQYNQNKPIVKTAEKILGCECIFTKEPRDIVKELKKALAESDESGLFPLVMIIDDCAEKIDENELANILKNGAEKFYLPVVIAKTPEGILDKFAKKQSALLKSAEISSAAERLEKIFGVKPAVLEIFDTSSALLLPDDDGYLLLNGD